MTALIQTTPKIIHPALGPQWRYLCVGWGYGNEGPVCAQHAAVALYEDKRVPQPG